MSKLLCNVLKFSRGTNAPNDPLVARLVLIYSEVKKLNHDGLLDWLFQAGKEFNFNREN